MKVLIIGGVAAGTKTAAKLLRADRSAEVTVLTRDRDISYAGCGLPYYVGNRIESRDELIVNTPQKFSALTGARVETGVEVLGVNPGEKSVSARNLTTGEACVYTYDRLVIASGASAVVPKLPGAQLPGVFKVRTPDDAIAIRAYATGSHVRNAVVIGGGFIGLEMAENLKALGVAVTVVEAASQLMPEIFDPEMADYIRRKLAENGVRCLTATLATQFEGEGAVRAVRTQTGVLPCELAIVAVGVRPNTAFLEGSGIEMDRGRVVVDDALRTNLPDVYAVGDCAMVTNRLTGARQWSPMGSSANLEGRTLGQILAGGAKRYPGVLGTGVAHLPGLNCARTGLTEDQARAAGYDVITALTVTDDKAHYYPDASLFSIKLVADRATRRLLGAQALGKGSVDKIIDVAVTGINLGATLEDFECADYAYAPPFSTAIHPFVQAVHVLQNKLDGALVSITPREYLEGVADDYTVVDAGRKPGIRGAKYVDLTTVNGPVEGLAKDEKLLLVCNRGKRAYFLQNRLRHFGYTNTAVLEGATQFNDVRVKNVSAAVSPEDMTRVKALGFLWDKTSADRFNGRVITRNGKVTAEESAVIAEAAKRFGSGEITMTSRLTLEIQGVPFDNIEPLREFLAQHGLETGGTGSKVRPVVSCKGTTCQYGLIDTFDLSREIHERFYKGYSGVKLPHKFKIAVGGCPNNCVKPDLNDLGIIGQRVPEIDMDKCRGCKVCQIERACPIKAVSMKDGKVVVDPEACNHCGRCLGKCPFKAFEKYTGGYRVYIGGRWGKKVARGQYLEKVFTDREEVLSIVEKAILLFREQGLTGERFADTVARLGFENVQSQLLSDELLQRKEENLTAQKHLKGGATC